MQKSKRYNICMFKKAKATQFACIFHVKKNPINSEKVNEKHGKVW